MKQLTKITSLLLTLLLAVSLAACGGKSGSEKNNATADETALSPAANAVEKSDNVNGMRFQQTLMEFTEHYNAEKSRRQERDVLTINQWQNGDSPDHDSKGVPVEYWYYKDGDLSFTATLETQTNKLLNIGCGTTRGQFEGTTGKEFNSDIIIAKAALMAQVICGFPEESDEVLQDIFYRITVEDYDSLWFKGFVFDLSTKEDASDSKNDIMLFRVFPITDDLKNEWKLEEYQ